MIKLLAATLLLLVVLGFNQPLWWILAVAILYFLYHSSDLPFRRYGRRSVRDEEGYRAYRERRDNQARWERRYRRDPHAHPGKSATPGRK